VTVAPIPEAVVQRPDSLLLRWPDGDAVLNATELRGACRCAECRAAALQGHAWTSDKNLLLTSIGPIGHYALQLKFSDGHDRGIYPWELLHELSQARRGKSRA
jgi:DUF971 family protein